MRGCRDRLYEPNRAEHMLSHACMETVCVSRKVDMPSCAHIRPTGGAATWGHVALSCRRITLMSQVAVGCTSPCQRVQSEVDCLSPYAGMLQNGLMSLKAVSWCFQLLLDSTGMVAERSFLQLLLVAFLPIKGNGGGVEALWGAAFHSQCCEASVKALQWVCLRT